MGRPPTRPDIYVADFETTVYEGQEETAVWAAAIVKIGTEDVTILNSIEGFFRYIDMLPNRKVVYFHNLKFDGSFILDYLVRVKDIPQAFSEVEGALPDKDMTKPSVKYNISNKGQWYTITYKNRKGYITEFRDSLKLLPFSVRQLGEGFKTKHRKLHMKYEGYRYPGCTITEQEKEYIANDVLVVKEALEIMFVRGHNKLTIGACCLAEFKQLFERDVYEALFPNQYEVELNPDIYEATNAGEYIRSTYKGAWCYVVPEKANRVQYLGMTFDVNSLYPSVMHSDSGNYYPVGQPRFWNGNYIPEKLLPENNHTEDGTQAYYWFIKIRTKFKIKPNKLPFLQIKRDFRYKQNEMLTTSDFHYKGQYLSHIVDDEGNIIEAKPTLSLTMTDYYLMLEHYDLIEPEILSGCYYRAEIGLFDTYINKYAEQKINAKTKAERTEAKLFLNNLYGKLAASPDSSYKTVYVKDEKLSFLPHLQYEKKPGYIPCGSAVTSYARYFTITAAQKNYYGPDQPGFVYADTDSLHISMLKPEQIIGVPEHPTAFLHWKNETKWNYGLFVRQKTYIEHVTEADGEALSQPYYNLVACGMPDRCQTLLKRSISGQKYNPDDLDDIEEDYDDEEIEFMNTQRDITDFRVHLKVPGCLKAKRIKGGVILNRGEYILRP